MFRVLPGHTDSVLDVSFSPDGKTIASASHDKTIKLWNGDGTLLKTLKLHPDTDKVRSASFSHDGKMLASASYDYTVILWDLNQWNADLDVLLVRGCDWARDYLKNNPNVQESDRTLCDDIPTPPSPPSESEYFLRNINLFNSGCCKNG